MEFCHLGWRILVGSVILSRVESGVHSLDPNISIFGIKWGIFGRKHRLLLNRVCGGGGCCDGGLDDFPVGCGLVCCYCLHCSRDDGLDGVGSMVSFLGTKGNWKAAVGVDAGTVGDGEGDRDLEIIRPRACAERWLLLEVDLDSALVTALSGRAAALASARVDGDAAASDSASEGVSSVDEVVEAENGFHIED